MLLQTFLNSTVVFDIFQKPGIKLFPCTTNKVYVMETGQSSLFHFTNPFPICVDTEKGVFYTNLNGACLAGVPSPVLWNVDPTDFFRIRIWIRIHKFFLSKLGF
jgi:hypothetical protein